MQRFIIYLTVVLSILAEKSLEAQSFTCAGIHHLQEELQPLASAKRAQSELPPYGQVNVLVIFAQFANETPGTPLLPGYASSILDPDLPGSFTHFYRTMSEGQLSVAGTVLPKRYASDQPAPAYLSPEPTEFGQYGRFVREVLRKVDRDIDFGQFDNDGPDGVPNSGDDDGTVDYIFVNVLSTPRNFLLGGSTGVAGLGMDGYHSSDPAFNGGRILVSGGRKNGSFQKEGGNLAHVVGSMAHEFGHSLGLPDLYDFSHLRNPGQGPAEDSAGIGGWGLMGWGALGWNGNDGPNAFSAWSLEQLGWIGYRNQRLRKIVGDAEGLHVADLYQGGQIYKVPLPPVSAATYQSGRQAYVIQEPYLLLEYRSRDTHYYRRNLPGEGLLVWQIRPYGNNGEEEDKLVDLICADGSFADAGFPLGRIANTRTGRDNLDFWSYDGAYRTAHQGNMGDATDPFDGINFTRLAASSNPGLVPISAASSGVSISSMRPQGRGMALDIALPQWAGTIRELVHWQGEVQVLGDVEVAPEGRLTILEDTRVYVAAQDRLQGGRDPSQCEIYFKGQVNILQSQDFGPGAFYIWEDHETPTDPVLFQSAEPGGQWHGLVIDPAPSTRLHLPATSFELHDATSGLVMADAPPGAQGLTLHGYTLVDISDPEEAQAGNDGLLGRGDIYQMVVGFTDWSLTPYEEVQAQLRWDVPWITSAQEASTRSITSAPFSIYPGRPVEIQLPSITLESEAEEEQELDFTVHLLQGQNPLWQQRLTVAVPVEAVPTAVVEGAGAEPEEFALLPNFPNPFNPETTIPYLVPGGQTVAPAPVQLDIFDIHGQRLRTLVNSVQAPGAYQVRWDGLDQGGYQVASGMYIAQLRMGGRATNQRLMLIK
ncbi:MAG: hypothetical protein GKR89_21485 [Candidatus Latescibacteria bacterium]|nr:hypothetical protein [Candidatus Latescibacterota bacterium]